LKAELSNAETEGIDSQMLVPTEFLTFGDKNMDFIRSMKENNPASEWMDAKEICERYPIFENIPDYYVGNLGNDAGIIKVKNALGGFKQMAERYGAKLRYNSEVLKAEANSVTLKSGEVIHAQHVVVCCGAYSLDRFDKQYSNVSVLSAETFTLGGDISTYFTDNALGGIPGIIFECSEKYKMYGLKDNQQLTQYKFGLHSERNLKLSIEWVRERIPSKIKDMAFSNV